ncbi:MAG: radical SAM protein [Elusimicrobiota bacterium]
MTRLGSLCYEDYPPLDGAYQDRSYGRRLSLREARGFWRKTREAGLYVHWPFCRQRCAYCYCDSRVPDPGEEARYLKAVQAELRLFSKGLRFTSFLLAGGTPTEAAPGRLESLLRLAPGAEIVVEATPASLDNEKLRILRAHRISRVDLGIDSLDAAVLRKAGRVGQDRAVVRAAYEGLAGAGIRVEASLLCGLPEQEESSFLADVEWVLGLRPSVLRLYAFEPRPQTAFKRCTGCASEALGLADGLMAAAGYGCPKKPWRLPRSVLGVGAGAKSHAFAAGWYQHSPLAGRPFRSLGPFFGMELSLADEERRFIVRGLGVNGRVSRAAFRKTFGRDVMGPGPLSRDLLKMEKAGGLSIQEEEIRLLGPTHSLALLCERKLLQRILRNRSVGLRPTRCRVYEHQA